MEYEIVKPGYTHFSEVNRSSLMINLGSNRTYAPLQSNMDAIHNWKCFEREKHNASIYILTYLMVIWTHSNSL